jgi:hypothetical protein
MNDILNPLPTPRRNADDMGMPQDKTVAELRDIPFPRCGRECRALAFFGVCECEGFCPHKFSKDGEPIDPLPSQSTTEPQQT